MVLGVARLVYQKDISTLIRAFAILRKQHATRLVILGEGGERQALTELIEELGIGRDVALPGFVRNPYNYMRAAGVFALSSRWEGLPTVLVEALACGTRVVSTDCPSGPAEILEHGKWGSLVPVGRPEVLAAAMGDALERPALDPRLDCALRRFGVEKPADEYLKILLPSKQTTVINGGRG